MKKLAAICLQFVGVELIAALPVGVVVMVYDINEGTGPSVIGGLLEAILLTAVAAGGLLLLRWGTRMKRRISDERARTPIPEAERTRLASILTLPEDEMVEVWTRAKAFAHPVLQIISWWHRIPKHYAVVLTNKRVIFLRTDAFRGRLSDEGSYHRGSGRVRKFKADLLGRTWLFIPSPSRDGLLRLLFRGDDRLRAAAIRDALTHPAAEALPAQPERVRQP